MNALRDAALAGLAGLFLAVHFATWISSLTYTSVANSVVLVNTIPIWVAILTPCLTQDRISRRGWASVGISVMGGILIGLGDFAVGSDALGQRALLGDTLALVGGVCAAVYLVLGRSLRARWSLLPYVTVCYGNAAIVLWIMVLVGGWPVTGFSAGTWGALIGMALISQHAGHSGYNYALKFFSANTIAVALLGEPILSTVWAYLLFDERLTWVKGTGAALILTGIYLAASEPRSSSHAPG